MNCNLNTTEILDALYILWWSLHTLHCYHTSTQGSQHWQSSVLSISLIIPPLRELHPATPGHQGTIKETWMFLVFGACCRKTSLGKLWEEMMISGVCWLRNSFSVNWRFPDLAAKGTVLILSQCTGKERIYLLWVYKPMIIWKATQGSKVSAAVTMA